MGALDNAAWRKSSYSGGSNGCVEVAVALREVGVRDTKNRNAGHITVTANHWREFISRLK